MHLVRIHVKPRPQHGPHLPTDQTDPTAVNIRRGYELPTRSEQVARWSSSIWQHLPFIGQVSLRKIDSIRIAIVIVTKRIECLQTPHEANSY